MQLFSDKFKECELYSDKRYLTNMKRNKKRVNENREYILHKLKLQKHVRAIFLCNISQALNLLRLLFTFI